MFTFRGQWVSVVVMMGRLGKKETVGERTAGRIIFRGKERRKRMEIFWKKNQRLGFFKGKKGKMSTKKEDGGWEEGREKGKEKEERKDERGAKKCCGAGSGSHSWTPLSSSPSLLLFSVSLLTLFFSLLYPVCRNEDGPLYCFSHPKADQVPFLSIRCPLHCSSLLLFLLLLFLLLEH